MLVDLVDHVDLLVQVFVRVLLLSLETLRAVLASQQEFFELLLLLKSALVIVIHVLIMPHVVVA
jgi:hypothetical protein